MHRLTALSSSLLIVGCWLVMTVAAGNSEQKTYGHFWQPHFPAGADVVRATRFDLDSKRSFDPDKRNFEVDKKHFEVDKKYFDPYLESKTKSFGNRFRRNHGMPHMSVGR